MHRNAENACKNGMWQLSLTHPLVFGKREFAILGDKCKTVFVFRQENKKEN